MTARQLLERLRRLWHTETGPSGLRAALAVCLASLIGGILLARVGNMPARIAGLAFIAASTTPLWWRRRVLEHRKRSVEALVRTTLLTTDRALGQRALRAYRLSEQTTHEPQHGSPVLAELHLARVLGRAPTRPIAERASRLAWLWSLAALLITIGAFGTVALDPHRMVEGVGILAATDGVAPLRYHWVDDVEVDAEPPSYLSQRRQRMRPFHPAALPAGTVLTVRATPLHSDRQLVLTDGRAEILFVDDGAGAVVARWQVIDDAEIHVAARFGDVHLLEHHSMDVHAVADLAPYVNLRGAPRSARLLDEPAIPIHYEATDDHGLREIALVLRAGEQEERRILSEPKGSARSEKGGLFLRSDDPFLERSYLPVEITVQARDGDPVEGPKWGTSDALIVIPPRIAEREALRYQALLNGRHALTDLLAARMTDDDLSDRRQHRVRESTRQGAALAVVRDALGRDYAGLWVPGRLRAIVEGQLERLDKDLARARTGALSKHHVALVDRTEKVLLAYDAALDMLGELDTRRAARQLSEVASEAADSIRLSAGLRERRRAEQRLRAALDVLEGGGGQLKQLGSLGRDLGEIVDNGLRRIRRGWDANDRHHARLAAEDLAARLRLPDPSFGSKGGGGSGSVESGGRGSPIDGQASEAAREAAELMGELERLRQEHASETSKVEQALDDAMSASDDPALNQELEQQARAVREAIKDLPRMASDSASARSAAASGRAQGESMAAALEKGKLSEAVRRGNEAIESLKQAESRASGAPGGSPERELGDEASEARSKLEKAMSKARGSFEQAGQKASEQAGGVLDRAARRERALAERARELRRQSDQGEAPLPSEMLERLSEAARAMEGAAQKLEQRDGPKGLEAQKHAQRLLEMSQPEQEQPPPSKRRHGDEDKIAQDAEVPGEKRDEHADRFRKRVTDGLQGDVPPHLRDALRRYTEGLLR